MNIVSLLQCGGLMEKVDPELLKCTCQPKKSCRNCIECSHNYRALTWFLHITLTFLLLDCILQTCITFYLV